MNDFTFEYAQPGDYHFCQDSLLLAELIASQPEVQALPKHARVLDVCAGCGVVGFELAHRLPQIQNLDFLEIQNEFSDSFHQNLRITGRNPETFRWINVAYSSLLSEDAQDKYDLIVGNPPYFDSEEGALSPNQLSNRCRFFIDESFETLVRGVTRALHPQGSAYLLVKSGARHGRNSVLQTRLIAGPEFQIDHIGDIRGTDVLRFKSQSLR